MVFRATEINFQNRIQFTQNVSMNYVIYKNTAALLRLRKGFMEKLNGQRLKTVTDFLRMPIQLAAAIA